MTEHEERDILTDACLDDFEREDDDEDRWKPQGSACGLRDRRSAIRKQGGWIGL